MLKTTALRSGFCLLALALSACSSFLKQPAAPTETGNTAADTAAAADNPYGTAPYTPDTSAPAAPYTPPATTVAVNGYVPNYSPVDITAATHTVERGDTVYNIAKRFQISQDNLREWNHLADNNIRIGQVLRVKPAGYVAPPRTTPATQPAAPVSAPATPATTVVTPPPTTTAPAAPTTVAASSDSRTVGGITWQIPTAGSILQNYGGSNKGIDFGGKSGQPVVAAAAGKVVYAGSGLRGYGNLLIVQHNQTYLTAYGNNQTLLVKEGQQVKRGQQIATMGNTDAKRTQLHFELRENGQPVDPKKYLPM